MLCALGPIKCLASCTDVYFCEKEKIKEKSLSRFTSSQHPVTVLQFGFVIAEMEK